MEVSFVMVINRNMQLIYEIPEFTLQVVKNDKKDSSFRAFEKTIRPKGYQYVKKTLQKELKVLLMKRH